MKSKAHIKNSWHSSKTSEPKLITRDSKPNSEDVDKEKLTTTPERD